MFTRFKISRSSSSAGCCSEDVVTDVSDCFEPDADGDLSPPRKSFKRDTYDIITIGEVYLAKSPLNLALHYYACGSLLTENNEEKKTVLFL